MKTMSRTITVIVFGLLFLSSVSCVSSTRIHFYSDVDETEVYVDGKYIGITPTTKKLSNAIWNDPTITLKKEGYKTITTDLKKDVKGANVALGILINWPAWLWCYGPKSYQYYIMIPDPNAQK